ncbi:hypothetical protein [Erwinia amylovora]|uniref:hypothetical protein n=1 Tax=Erwinia amylovora TaxID=552 RepID=UPI000C084F39|nr:hypothetical protein [Erwinia amylovora]
MKKFLYSFANLVNFSAVLMSQVIMRLFRIVILWPAFITGLIVLFIVSLYIWKGPDVLTAKYASEADSYRSVLAGHIRLVTHEIPKLSPLTKEDFNAMSETRTEKVLTFKEAAESDLSFLKTFWLALIILGGIAEALGLSGRGQKEVAYIKCDAGAGNRKPLLTGESHE